MTEQLTSSSDSSPGTILVGDDFEAMRNLMTRVLRSEGYDVRQAIDTQGVLDGLVSETPDLLVLDMSMPGGGGVRVIEQMRENPALEGVKVLMVSGAIHTADSWPSQVGADAQLPKPFKVNELVSAVRSLLAA